MTPSRSPGPILADLIAIPSVSHLSNRPIIGFLQNFFSSPHWQQRLFSYTDPQGIEKLNLVVGPALPHTGPIEVELAVVCHTDTVPAAPDWTKATQVHEHDGNLHGLGACDVKGFLACMLAAAPTLASAHLSRRFCFVFTADEEIGCRGARFLLETAVLRARYAIVGEPTSLIPSRAGKGYCLASINVRGKAGHSALPSAGASAIFAAARLIVAIEDLAADLTADRDESFSPPFTTLNIGEIHGGTAKNILPAECTFLLEWRPVPHQSPTLVADRVRTLAAAIEHDLGPDISISLNVQRLDTGFSTPADSPVLTAVITHPETALQTISFGTEAPWLARMGADAVVFGPGSMLTAHSSRECVSLAELTRCTKILQSAVLTLCR